MSRTALVTGATAGIGEATVRALVAIGWRCVATGRRAERLQALGARPLTPPDPDLRLRAFLLPEALAPGPDPAARAAARRAGLLAEGVVVYVQPFLGEVVLRLSGAPYVDAEDVDRLADAIARRAGRRAEV